MIPHGRSLVTRFADRPLALVSIYADSDGDKLRAALKGEKVSWTAVWDGRAGPIHTAWNVEALPTVYVIDSKGVIRYKSPGFHALELDAAIDEALKSGEATGGSGK